jgi:hypothetical protein
MHFLEAQKIGPRRTSFEFVLVPAAAAGGNSQTFRLPSLAVMPRIRYVF